ncbi:MAG: deoxyribose-phosphate aldolase [Candidatus Nanopelagicaceae bacterium]|jgi:deoxyribose-phosphate aldolase
MAHPKYSKVKVAKTIDHSLLKPEMTRDEVRQGCEIAKKYDVASVCCKPSDVAFCAEILQGTDVEIGTVVGFPHGSSTTETKVFETKNAIANGATEIDMVLNIGQLKSGLYDAVKSDIGAVVAAAGGKMVKVILENAYLTDDEKIAACKLCEAAGAHYVKTSSGYAPSGATIADVKLMRAAVSPVVKVKSAGGVRTLDALIEMLDAGVERSGATTTSTMLDEYTQRFGD